VVGVIEIDTEAVEYERTLTDEQLVGLSVTISQRVQALLGQGVPLPMQQIENHHLIGLLECFVGPEDSLRVREWHLNWVDRQLDAVEAQVRAQVLQTPGLEDMLRDVRPERVSHR
jgi:hypothetical protein